MCRLGPEIGRAPVPRINGVTPAALADLLHAVAVDVLTERGLDTAVLPDTVTVERPRNPEHGDYATNLALRSAKKAGVAPAELAGWLATRLEDTDAIATAEVAGPGFLNLRLAADAQAGIVDAVLTAGEAYGHTDALTGQAINLEFVSANPTGPIHLGGTRWAAVGDALGRVLASQGAAVTREYYVNDAGAQIDRFAESLLAAAEGRPVPENGYGGAYVAEVAQKVLKASDGLLDQPEAEKLAAFKRLGVEAMLEEMRASLESFGTHFDVWSSEQALHSSGAVERSVQELKDDDALYFADGAWWLRSSDHGDDKDRVVIKSDGRPAYIAGDIAYYRDKRARGADLAIYMLGADHHGYIHRLKAVAAAFGDDPARVEVLIGQLVSLVRDGAAGEDVQARRHDHHAGGPRRRRRRGRGALHAGALVGRPGARDRPRPDLESHEREPRVLRAVRARPARVAGPQRRRPGRLRGEPGPRAADPPARGRPHPHAGRVPARAVVGREPARAAPRRALPRGAGGRLPPVLRHLPRPAAGRRGAVGPRTPPASRSAPPRARCSPTVSACSV